MARQISKRRPGLGSATICVSPPGPDLLSEVLQDLRLAHASYGRSELTAPWGIEIPFKEGVRFHFAAEGECWMLSQGQPPTHLECGDVVLLPHGTAHVIADEPGRRPSPIDQLSPALVGNASYQLTTGGGGKRALVVCCTIGFEGPTANPLLSLLPPMLHVRAADHKEAGLAAILEMMAIEVQSRRIGSATIMARLADIVLTQIIRTWVETRDVELTGWLAAIKDPQIGLALACIHRRPGALWDVEMLAESANMSRSKFSERFGELLGTSPARYLLQWRMRLAAAWLRNGHMTIAETAAGLGYQSDASFSRAFKRFMGVSPGAVRAGHLLDR